MMSRTVIFPLREPKVMRDAKSTPLWSERREGSNCNRVPDKGELPDG
jgi:hypothetical protein